MKAKMRTTIRLTPESWQVWLGRKNLGLAGKCNPGIMGGHKYFFQSNSGAMLDRWRYFKTMKELNGWLEETYVH